MPLNADPLWYWIVERQRIYRRRMKGQPFPWTEDPILREYRFCNVFRELDKVTVWIRKNWREPYANHPNLWFAMLIARRINWPPTLRKVGFPKRDYDPGGMRGTLQSIIDMGEKAFTGAYMISASPVAGVSQAQYTAETVLLEPWKRRREILTLFSRPDVTLQSVHKWLKQFQAWGDFMAYEVVTDLRHTRYLRDAPDINTWAVAGPGAIRGLNRLHGRPFRASLSQEQACYEMRQLLTLSRAALPALFPKLELRDIEHSLCETDKYLRMLNGEGSMRARYRP